MTYTSIAITICLILSVILLILSYRNSRNLSSLDLTKIQLDWKPIFENLDEQFKHQNEYALRGREASDRLTAERVSNMNQAITSMLEKSISEQKQILEANQKLLASGLEVNSKTMETRLDNLTKMLYSQFETQRKTNSEQIEKIRESVNEKLDKTINEQFEKSFKNVINQMNSLQTTMGELKSISTQVGSLEKTLNGVKTRGILGETQLRSIIENVLNPNQFDIEVPTIPGSTERVEIAIKIPDNSSDSFVYLPVDSKCHLDRFEALQNAYESGDQSLITREQKAFADAIRNDCKDISSKYISSPHTTNFGILFVPFEGMYSEVIKLNLLETLNKEHITIAGPYTMLAILGTIVNYYQSLAVVKQTDKIEATLMQTKKAFTAYDEQLMKVKKNLDLASRNIDDLQGVKTKKILRALNDVLDYDGEGIQEGSSQVLIDDINNTAESGDISEDIE